MPILGIVQGATVPVKIWAPVHEVESQALDQLRNIASLPWVYHHVAAMPDVHLGKGATVGSVIAMKNAIAPSAVGVDIGCGMCAVKTSLTANDLDEKKIKAIYNEVVDSIPVGFNGHDEPVSGVRKLKMFSDDRFGKLTDRVQDIRLKAMQQCGTLGGGNHFIELCLDTNDVVWLMLHSGSRNIGKEIAQAHINVAKHLEHNARLPDPELAVFLAGTPEMVAYRHDLMWAQEYAYQNRQFMMDIYLQIILDTFSPLNVQYGEPINCHHNYVSEETHFGENLLVTRKGAIRARVGDAGIIPGAMGRKSFIVMGRGNPDAFESASHGAGRRMSRGEAKRKFTEADLAASTAGVVCRKDHGVVDEIGEAYKDIEAVMANQEDLVTIVAELRGVMCVKG